jgi:prophage regulatory protein
MAEQLRTALSILRRKHVEVRCRLSRSGIYGKMNPKCPSYDPTFPKPISIGARAVGWIESEISEWLASRVELSRGKERRSKSPTASTACAGPAK